MNTQWIEKEFDIAFSKTIMEELAQITDHPRLGGRTAGSEAEHRAADYLMRKFVEAGLQHVTKDPCPVDSWTFTESTLSYLDTDGAAKETLLGGFACNAQFSDERFRLIFAGRGTEADYEGIDVKGKLVLIEINQAEDWWINFPAFEAKLRGAAGVVCINTGGFGQEGENVLVSEDICGPSDMVAFSIGKKDGMTLKRQIAAEENQELDVTLNVCSIVSEGGTSYNIWGDIPGKTEEVIYIINHYDSYYYTIFDDVQGIGWALGLAKAFVESGWKPEKTIRFVAHGAEEWGTIDCKYDWAVGAYKQITSIRPEWKDTGFAVVNLDGFYAVAGEKKFCIVCTHELYDFVFEAVRSFGNTGVYEIKVNMELTSSTEDFSYTKAGIPSFVAGAYDGCLADRKVLHSSDSGWSAGFDDRAFALFHNLFAYIISVLDSQAVCPINLERKLYLAFKGISQDLGDRQTACFADAVEEAKTLNRNITVFNASEFEPEKARLLNHELHEIYREIHKRFVRLNWNDEMVLPHERYADNLDALRRGMEAVKAEDYRAAAEFLMEVDFNYYTAFFSEETCDYFERQVTEFPKDSWGTGLIENGSENLSSVIRALRAERFGDQEEKRLEDALKNQKNYYEKAVFAEIKAAGKVGECIAGLNRKF